MNHEAVSRIERRFDCILHDDYKRLLLGFPESLAKMLSAERDRVRRRIFADARTITSINKLIRNPDKQDDPSFFDWQEKYFIIGGDDGGNLYCMNLKSKLSSVYFWFHEDGDFEPYAKSINEFILKVFHSYGKCAVDELNFVRL